MNSSRAPPCEWSTVPLFLYQSTQLVNATTHFNRDSDRRGWHWLCTKEIPPLLMRKVAFEVIFNSNKISTL